MASSQYPRSGPRRPALDPNRPEAPDLPGRAARLARERSWIELTALFESLGAERGATVTPLADLELAVRRVSTALEGLGVEPGRSGETADELRTLRLASAEALLARCGGPPFLAAERRAAEQAAELLGAAGDHRRAAVLYEDLAEDGRAADAWGALGELDRMEAAHAREDSRRATRRAAGELRARFEALLTGGERLQAIQVAASAGPAGLDRDGSVGRLSTSVERRLCRGRAVSLREPAGPWIRCALLPVEIGRDLSVDLPLRDPSVSRRHAVLRATEEGVSIADAGSRTGILLHGARLAESAALPLLGEGELGLGPTTKLRFRAAGQALLLEGASGFDRGFRALVGSAPVPLGSVFPGADGLALILGAGGVRLTRRSDLAVRVDGHFVGPGCDLLHGDAVELPSAGLRLEVE